MSVREYVAAIHAHSVYSDGSGQVEEIIEAAQSARVDVLILTDHNCLDARDLGYEGWHDDLLLIVGDEVSSRSGHVIALGVDTHVNHRQPLPDILEGIRSGGGTSYIAHPHGGCRPFLKWRDHSWQDWAADSATGLELWSYMFDWISDFHYVKFPRFYRDPDACLRGPHPDTIAKWDELCQRRRVVAFGGVDAHARKYPLLPLVVFPYETLFRTIRTHVLSEELTRDADHDIPLVLQAMSEGRCFLARDNLADSSGTRFESTDGSLSMGSESFFAEGTGLRVDIPVESDIRLLKDGTSILEQRGKAFEHTADSPGVYRVEARIDDLPWLFTNPIYLREPDTASS